MLMWLKNRPRYLAAILTVALSAYALDRWFFSGLVASKWIGLPEYASAMNELLVESHKWGIVALILGSTAVALGLPRWPRKESNVTTGSVLTLGSERNVWTGYLGRCILHAAICIIAVVGSAILIYLIAGLSVALFRR